MRTILLTLALTAVMLGPALAQDWQQVGFPNTDNITGIDFISADTGFAVTGEGRIAITFNAGKEWYLAEVVAKVPLEDIHFLNADTGFVCGHRGTLLRTTDGGHRFRDVSPMDSSCHLMDIEMLTNQIGLTVGIRQTAVNPYESVVLRTTDGGATWTRQPPLGLGPLEICITPAGKVCVLTFGQMMISDDQGKTWRQVRTVDGVPGRTISIHGQTGIMGGPSSLLARSVDGGETWLSTPTSTETIIISSQMVNDKVGYVGGSPKLLWHTSNSGVDWTPQTPPNPFTVLDFCLIDNYLWAAGAKGNIIRKKVR